MLIIREVKVQEPCGVILQSALITVQVVLTFLTVLEYCATVNSEVILECNKVPKHAKFSCNAVPSIFAFLVLYIASFADAKI